MKRMSIVLVVIVLLVVGVGFYRGWFAFSSGTSDAGSNKVDVNLTVDGDKIQEDGEAVKQKATELTGQVAEEANKIGGPTTDKK